MSTLDDRTRDAAQRLHADTSANADTDGAWQQFATAANRSGHVHRSSADRRRSIRWVSTGLAVGLVAAALVAVIVLRADRQDTITDVPSITDVTTPPTAVTVPASTSVPATTPSTGLPETPPPTTAAPTTAAPTTAAPTTAAPTTLPPPAVPSDLTFPSGATIAGGSFTSTTDGWIVTSTPSGDETRVDLQHTTDRGAHWTVVEVPGLDAGDEPSAVRFADATNGWIRTTSAVLSTHDGGASWTRMTGLPSEVLALETATGLVHIVGFDQADTSFGVWTSPIDRDEPTQSAVRIMPGAGPVADFQIVLQREIGWIVYNDRIVINGARLVDGEWISWTPPCVNPSGVSAGPDDLLGPVRLAASRDGADLVAVCQNSGFAGQPANPRVFVSGDDGVTFTETAARLPDSVGGGELAGAVFSSGAVIDVTYVAVEPTTGAAMTTLAVTEDGGATWRRMLDFVPLDGEPVGADASFMMPDGTIVIPIASEPVAGRAVAAVSDNGGLSFTLLARG